VLLPAHQHSSECIGAADAFASLLLQFVARIL
jgi:hypothetical protein